MAFETTLERVVSRLTEVSIDSGDATGGSLVTIVDTTKNWEVNKWVDAIVEVEVDNVHYYRTVTSNTADTLTITALPAGHPVAAGDHYNIRLSTRIVTISGQTVTISSGNIAVVSGNVAVISGEIHVMSGQLIAKVSGEVVKISGETVIAKTSGETHISKISGETIIGKISGEVVQISGQVVRVSGETVIAKVSGETVVTTISGNVVKVSGETIIAKISGETVIAKVSGETVIAKVSGETVIGKISGEVVQISGQVVKISGETVIAKVSGEIVTAKVSGETVSIQTPTMLKTGPVRTLISASGGVVLHSGAIKAAVVKALTDNSGIVLVGGSGDRPWYESVGSAQGLILAAGETQSKDVNDFSAIYVVAQVSGDKVCFEGVN